MTAPVHVAKATDLIVSMLERRQQFRQILGDRYESAVEPYRKVLRGKQKESGLPIAKVALQLSKELDGANCDPGLMICALVEECEMPR